MPLTLKVSDYLILDNKDKLDFFIKNLSTISRPASYWFNFSNVQKNMELYGPDLFTLDWLLGKTEQDMYIFFKERPILLKMIPQLLGIRNDKFEKEFKKTKEHVLKVQGVTGEYFLNFTNIDMENFDKYIEFIQASGLDWILLQGVRKSLHDYAVGVEAGMDSNGRKNRSGEAGELYLEELLSNISENYKLECKGQTTWNAVKKDYGITLNNRLRNVRFDGSLFNRKNQKLFLFEVNNFGSIGTKLKSSGGEFQLRKEAFEGTNHEFIYITDGQGWNGDKSHLIEIISKIGTVFNFKMLENGYLEDYINQFD